MTGYILSKLGYDYVTAVTFLNNLSEEEVQNIVTEILIDELGAESVNLNYNSKMVNIGILIENYVSIKGPKLSGVTYPEIGGNDDDCSEERNTDESF